MATKVTITPVLNEEDSTPGFEVADENGNVAFSGTLDEALDTVRLWTVPVLSLDDMARRWIILHGSNAEREGLQDDVESEFGLKFTNDQWDSFTNMVEYAKITVTFPYWYGAPPVA